MYGYTDGMRKQAAPKETKPTQMRKRSRTTLNLPEDLWKATKIRAIELGVDAQDLVALAVEQYLKKGGVQ
jgi:predicted DNA binding CopG/RHH family protein